MLRSQWVHEPCPPWNNTTGRPAPHWRHTMRPSPHAVANDVERASIAATTSAGRHTAASAGLQYLSCTKTSCRFRRTAIAARHFDDDRKAYGQSGSIQDRESAEQRFRGLRDDY